MEIGARIIGMSSRSVRTSCFVLALLLTGCFKERERQIKEVNQDEAILKAASAAANQVLRSATDCDAAKAALPEARQRVSEAFGKVKGEASAQTLRALDAQLKRVADACP
jgi:hypothetical protein